MTISATTLQMLMDGGFAGQRLLAVVKAIEADFAPKRSPGAERQKRYLARKKAKKNDKVEQASQSDVTNDVTNDAEPSSNIIITTTNQVVTELIPPSAPQAETQRVSRGTRLPDDWKPKPSARELWRNRGLPDEAYDDHVDRFRCYWWSVPGQRGRKADWHLTWLNRIKDIADHWKGPKNEASPKRSSVNAGFDRLRAAAGLGRPGDGGGGTIVEHLPGLLKSA